MSSNTSAVRVLPVPDTALKNIAPKLNMGNSASNTYIGDTVSAISTGSLVYIWIRVPGKRATNSIMIAVTAKLNFATLLKSFNTSEFLPAPIVLLTMVLVADPSA